MTSVEGEARKALHRLKRAIEKSQRELEALAGSLRHAEGADFPVESYALAEERMNAVLDFAEEEAMRLQEKILHAGGIEPGRIRRSGG